MPETSSTSFLEIPPLPFQRYTLRAYDELRANHPDAGLHWAHAIMFDVAGELRFEEFVRAYHAVLRHHEVFRSGFVKRDGRWVCRIAETMEPPVFCAEYAGALDDCKEAFFRDAVAFNNNWDVTTGPMLRAAVFRAKDRTICSIAGHRLIGDLHTVRLIVRDLTLAYAQAAAGDAVELPPVLFPLPDYVRRLQAELEAPPSDAAVAHMRACAEAPGNRNIPWVADASHHRDTPDWGYRPLGQVKDLADVAAKMGASVGDIVNAALEAALADWAEGPVAFGSIYHGRAMILGGRLTRPLRTCGPLEYFVPELAKRRPGESAKERVARARAARESIRTTSLDMFRVFERGLFAAGTMASWRKQMPIYVNYIQLGLGEAAAESDGPAICYTPRYEQDFQVASLMFAPKSRLPDFFLPLDVVFMENGPYIGLSVDPFDHVLPDRANALKDGVEREIATLLAALA